MWPSVPLEAHVLKHVPLVAQTDLVELLLTFGVVHPKNSSRVMPRAVS